MTENEINPDLFDEDFEEDMEDGFEDFDFDEDELDELENDISEDDDLESQAYRPPAQHKHLAPTHLRAGAICLLLICQQLTWRGSKIIEL